MEELENVATEVVEETAEVVKANKVGLKQVGKYGLIALAAVGTAFGATVLIKAIVKRVKSSKKDEACENEESTEHDETEANVEKDKKTSK